VKPFRTVEDLHVQAAVTGWLLGVLRRHGGPQGAMERLVAHALGLRALADASVEAPATHVALAGCFAGLEAITSSLEGWWASAPGAVASGWARDRALLTVARGAREARRVKAWEGLGA
jgi:acyl-CoA dehydrogenase